MTIKIIKSEFVYSVPKLSLMQNLSDECAFLGRSNAGKSSLINAICERKDLAKTSKTPGRTRHAVVYKTLVSHDNLTTAKILVDFPGFGFASMSKKEAIACQALIFAYLKRRLQLRIIVLVLDIRRVLDEREKLIINIANERDISLILVLTKSDKISLTTRGLALNKMMTTANLEPKNIVCHSTHDHKSTKHLQKIIFENF